jgi:hypothetical protein
MGELKKYVVTKNDYCQIVVSLTEREATVLRKFLDWGEIEDEFAIESLEDCEAVDWGI